ncbi:MAG: hypothetical protein M1812_005596 [Candelaria pacifica]|nr:MAG: hypothetical protein M1812_005596 [Candelaria pacifica]
MRTMRPFLLPLLVEARKSSESTFIDTDQVDSSTCSPSCPNTSSSLSSLSEFPSPVTPTFSARGHSRYPSSSSSLNSSPVLHGQADPAVGKRSLADVKEEPLEKEESWETFARPDSFSGSFYHDIDCRRFGASASRSSVVPDSTAGYDLMGMGGFSDDTKFPVSETKRARTGESPLLSFASRMGNRLPSISRRRKDRRTGKPAPVGRSGRDDPPSRAVSTRSSSITGSFIQTPERADAQYPPSPMRSSFGDWEEDCITSIDVEKTRLENEEYDAERRLASTPLLPPVMRESSSMNVVEPPFRSPLQSPAVADSPDPFSMANSPAVSPQLSRLPSPPLSTRPSLSSLHRRRVDQVLPSAEIPPIVIADPNDGWANKLGHANYNIHPEPYLPSEFDLDACEQMRANWDLARSNYMKHLVRTGEHYGVTSKTYKLTEEKWAEVDAHWKQNNDLTIAKLSERGISAITLHETTAEQTTKFPSLNGPCSDGKFPKLGDEDIVGPMVQIASQVHHRPSRRAAFLKFLQDIKFPKGVMTGGRPSMPRQSSI